MQATKVMLLGNTRFGALPQLRIRTMTSRRVTPQQPQNLFRAVTLNGLGATRAMLGRLAGPGDEIMDPWAANAEAAGALDNSQAVQQEQNVVIPGQATSIGAYDASGARITADTVERAQRALKIWIPLSLLSGALSAWHGYKRDRTAIAGFGWFTLGTMFPLITPAVAVAQGFGKPRRG